MIKEGEGKGDLTFGEQVKHPREEMENNVHGSSEVVRTVSESSVGGQKIEENFLGTPEGDSQTKTI